MSQRDVDGNRPQDEVDSIDIGLSDSDRQFLVEIDKMYSHETFESKSLDELADALLVKLKAASRAGRVVEVYELQGPEQDAAGILVQSGEALLYRDEHERLCITHGRAGLLEKLLSYG